MHVRCMYLMGVALSRPCNTPKITRLRPLHMLDYGYSGQYLLLRTAPTTPESKSSTERNGRYDLIRPRNSNPAAWSVTFADPWGARSLMEQVRTSLTVKPATP